MIWLVLIRVIVLVYATVGAIRARYRPALALLVPALSTIGVPLAVLVSDGGALVGLVETAPWLFPLVAALVGAWLTRHAFRTLDGVHAGSHEASHLETTAYALLANTLLDAALLVITAMATILVARSAF